MICPVVTEIVFLCHRYCFSLSQVLFFCCHIYCFCIEMAGRTRVCFADMRAKLRDQTLPLPAWTTVLDIHGDHPLGGGDLPPTLYYLSLLSY